MYDIRRVGGECCLAVRLSRIGVMPRGGNTSLHFTSRRLTALACALWGLTDCEKHRGGLVSWSKVCTAGGMNMPLAPTVMIMLCGGEGESGSFGGSLACERSSRAEHACGASREACGQRVVVCH